MNQTTGAIVILIAAVLAQGVLCYILKHWIDELIAYNAKLIRRIAELEGKDE